MKKLFYIGLVGLALFEVLKVYFIMPMPGSQRIDTIDIAYFLHTWRWGFRIVLVLALFAGAREAFLLPWKWRWLPMLLTLIGTAVVVLFNTRMTAEGIFKQPRDLVLKPRTENTVPEDGVVVAVEHNGEARAYPIRFLVYHHQVRDTIGGREVIVTYCSVCRTGRVFEPRVNGREEKFRLVGMDHFNAMFEDATTKSWWRQVTGEAVAGPLKGAALPEVASSQITLAKWFERHPEGLVMQADEAFTKKYDDKARFERGESKGKLTRMDPDSWKDKSWVVGVQVGGVSKAYDWKTLKEHRVINDDVGGAPVAVVLARDERSFAVFERPGGNFEMEGDTISVDGECYDFFGRNAADPEKTLKRVQAHQEFWHSWRTFHPDTVRYPAE